MMERKNDELKIVNITKLMFQNQESRKKEAHELESGQKRIQKKSDNETKTQKGSKPE